MGHLQQPLFISTKASRDWAIFIQSLEELKVDVHGANVAMRPQGTKKRWLIVPNLAACNINRPSLGFNSSVAYFGSPAQRDFAVIPTPLDLTTPQLSRSCSRSVSADEQVGSKIETVVVRPQSYREF